MIVKKENSFPFIAFLVLAGVIFLLYYPGTGGPYILDDLARLTANTKLKLTDLSLPAIYAAAFSEKSGILYRPIAMISFSLNYYIAGNTDAYSIKLTNIFIHILTTCGIFLLTIGLLRRAGIADDRRRWWTALFITALWALHPLHVSTVLGGRCSSIWGRTGSIKQGKWCPPATPAACYRGRVLSLQVPSRHYAIFTIPCFSHFNTSQPGDICLSHQNRY